MRDFKNNLSSENFAPLEAEDEDFQLSNLPLDQESNANSIFCVFHGWIFNKDTPNKEILVLIGGRREIALI